MKIDDPNNLFTMPEKREAEVFLDKVMGGLRDSDQFRDMLGCVRKGREPDYRNGHWCVRCGNSLPRGWVEPCDVCGAKTVVTVKK